MTPRSSSSRSLGPCLRIDAVGAASSRRIGALVAVLVIVAAGCGTAPQPSATQAAEVATVKALPVTTFVAVCRGIGLDPATVLRGSVDDPRSVWLELPDGRRRELVWPPLWFARFRTSSFEVLDPGEQVRFREGDRVQAACVKGPADDPGSILLIDPKNIVE